MSVEDQLLFTVEESLEDNFTTFHNNLFKLGLSNNAGMLYLFIKSMAYGKKTVSFPSVRTLAAQFGVTDRTIQNWVKELVNREIIKRIEWFNEKTKMQTSNRYMIRDISKIEPLKLSTGGEKFCTPENTKVEIPKTLEPTDSRGEKFCTPGVNQISPLEEIQYKELNWTVLGEYEKVWPFVKAVGDMAIDPESKPGFDLIKITLLEGASPDQLKDAIRELDKYTAAPVDNPLGFIRNKLRSYIDGDQICFSAWRRDKLHLKKLG